MTQNTVTEKEESLKKDLEVDKGVVLNLQDSCRMIVWHHVMMLILSA